MDELIEGYLDRAKVKADTDFYISELERAVTAYENLSKSKLAIQTGKPLTDLSSNVRQAAKDTVTLTGAQADLTRAIKEHEKTLAVVATAQAKSNALTSDAAIEVEKLKLQNQQQTKANKEVAQSVLGLVDDYGLLKKQYNEAANAAKNLQTVALNSGNANDKSVADVATAKARALHDSLLAIEQGVGQSQRNVGNYTGALKVLQGALGQAQTKLDSMTKAEQQNSVAGQRLSKEVLLLSTLVGQQDKGFISLRREVQNAVQALATLASQGLKDTEAFRLLQTEVANSKRELNEFNRQQKLLSSEAPALAGLTSAAKGLGAAYAIGAGAAALFANGDEKVAEKLQKLVAVMTLLQGLTELNAALQERSAIATSLNGVKTVFLNAALAIKNFILTGSIGIQRAAIAAEEADVVAKEAQAVATTEVAVATTSATTAMTVFRAALIATGIGALLVLIGATVVALSNMRNSTKDAADEMERLNTALEHNNEILGESIKNIDRQTQLTLADLKRRGASQKEQDAVEIKALRDKEVKTYQYYQIQKANLDAFDKETLRMRKEQADKIKAINESEGETIIDANAAKAKDDAIVKQRTDLGKKLRDATKKLFDDADELRFQADLKEKESLIKKKESLQELKDRLNTEFEIYKLNQERKIHLFDKELSDEKVYYTEKFTALDNSIKLQQELLNKQEAFDIAAKKREAAREIQHLQEQKEGKSGAELARINQNIKITQQNLEQEILLIKAKYADLGIKVVETSSDKRQKIVEDQLKKEEDAYKQYLETKKLLEEDATGDARIKKRFEHEEHLQKDFNEKKIALEKELSDKKFEVAQKAEDLLFTLATAGFDRQNNILEKQKDKAAERAQSEIDAINASTKSEQDKAAAIIIVNARLAAFKDAADRKEKENNLKKAKFEQAQQIFEIGINTIKALANIKFKIAEITAASALNPALLRLIPLVAAQIPFILGSSALSIAAVLAKPLPRFRYGKGAGNNYEGPGIVNDGTKQEAIERADGSIEFPQGRDVLTHVGRNDIIHPDKDAWLNAILNAAHRDASASIRITPTKSRNEVAEALNKQTKILTQIANKKELHLGAGDKGMIALWKWGAQTTQYIDQNTNW